MEASRTWRIAAVDGGRQVVGACGSDLGFGLDDSWWLPLSHVVSVSGSRASLVLGSRHEDVRGFGLGRGGGDPFRPPEVVGRLVVVDPGPHG